jgi:hypothetical protein
MIRPCFCVGYKADIMRGVHHEDDRYMMALYPAGADLTPYTKEYSSTGEITGAGYRAGGVVLSGFDVSEDGEAAVLTFDDVRIEKATLRGVVAGLVYNASKQNRAVGVVALAQETSSTNAPFEVVFPEATAADGVFVID